MIKLYRSLLLCSLVVLGCCDPSWKAGTAMLSKRSDMSATVVGRAIILAGGCDSNQVCPPTGFECFCTSLTTKTHSYDPSANTWTVLAPMLAERYNILLQLLETCCICLVAEICLTIS